VTDAQLAAIIAAAVACAGAIGGAIRWAIGWAVGRMTEAVAANTTAVNDNTKATTEVKVALATQSEVLRGYMASNQKKARATPAHGSPFAKPPRGGTES
jgi:fluoride ion exporter CrcB/FEX